MYSITLILVISDDAPSELHSTYLLEVIFGAMVLLIGLHELEEVSNKIERLKKELKVGSITIVSLYSLINVHSLSLSLTHTFSVATL